MTDAEIEKELALGNAAGLAALVVEMRKERDALRSDRDRLRALVVELVEALELWAECVGPNGETRMPSGPADLIARAKGER